MPNHIHMIIVIDNPNSGRQVVAPTVSLIVGQFKRVVSIQVRENIDNQLLVWQKSFHDHVIRDDESYKKIWDYVGANPTTWHDDIYYLKY